jgi:hypothetical protein
MTSFSGKLYEYEKDTCKLLDDLDKRNLALPELQARIAELEEEWNAIAKFANENYVSIFHYSEENQHIRANQQKLSKALEALTRGTELDHTDLKPSRVPSAAKIYSTPEGLVEAILKTLPETYVKSHSGNDVFQKVAGLIEEDFVFGRSYAELKQSDPKVMTKIEWFSWKMAGKVEPGRDSLY